MARPLRIHIGTNSRNWCVELYFILLLKIFMSTFLVMLLVRIQWYLKTVLTHFNDIETCTKKEKGGAT